MPSEQLLDGGHARVPALGDDVGRAERAGQLLARLVARHRDDPGGAEPRGGEHGAEADGAIPDDDDRAPRRDAGRDGGVVAGAHHVRQRQQARDELVARVLGRRHERAVGVRDADLRALAAVGESADACRPNPTSRRAGTRC